MVDRRNLSNKPIRDLNIEEIDILIIAHMAVIGVLKSRKKELLKRKTGGTGRRKMKEWTIVFIGATALAWITCSIFPDPVSVGRLVVAGIATIVCVLSSIIATKHK